jgi:hypothetical protein
MVLKPLRELAGFREPLAQLTEGTYLCPDNMRYFQYVIYKGLLTIVVAYKNEVQHIMCQATCSKSE